MWHCYEGHTKKYVKGDVSIRDSLKKNRESKRTGVTQTPWYRSRVNVHTEHSDYHFKARWLRDAPTSFNIQQLYALPTLYRVTDKSLPRPTSLSIVFFSPRNRS
jgi:hypothetical protein